MKKELCHDAYLEYFPGFVPPEESLVTLALLRRELAWEQRDIVLFGKRIAQPRLIAWAGELPYRYSGQTLEPRGWTPTVRSLRERVSAATGTDFNHVLLNRYRDGKDSMGLHADAEPELGEDPVVASLSFGVARRFTVRGRTRDCLGFDLMLEDGSLTVMGGAFQRWFRHGIPKDAPLSGERISLTFRALLRPPTVIAPQRRAFA